MADLVEPYFAFVIVDTIILVSIAVYVVYKMWKGELGESTVNYLAAEAGHEVSGGSEELK